MKFALFDAINEAHVCTALADALTARGHDVLATGRLTHGFTAVSAVESKSRIAQAVDRVIATGREVLFNFRAGALDHAQLARLRDAGITTVVWLPDDPVLYATTYADVVDAYDVLLHCGDARVLRLYDGHGHRPGVNFPFWLDPARWPYTWDLARARRPMVFMGNLHGPAKAGRYRLLAEAGGDVRVYGRCAADPAGIHAGELHGVDAMRAVMRNFVAGLNIAQRFADYAGTAYDFPGLAGLGGFDLPSRVPQYAAVGLPVISLDSAPSAHFRHSLAAPDVAAALRIAERLRSSPDEALALSRRARAHVEAHFSAASRARYLEALVDGRIRVADLDLSEREFGYQSV